MSNHSAPDSSTLPLILLVEDSATTKALLTRYLGGHYQLLHARDGEEAWEMLVARADIDLVITDIQMPRLTGQQLLIRIRKSDRPSLVNMPVIVMTTADDNADRNLAFLNGANDFINKPIDELELQARVNVHYRLARTIRELEANRQLLAEQATTDPLTRLKNRRAFFENGEKYLAHARRFGTDLSVIVSDIDFFKKINDTYGHQVGDEALVMLSRTLGQLTRGDDTLARLGGEEFAVLLPDTNRLGAAVLAERIRISVESEKLVVGDRVVTMTLSSGIASLRVDGGQTIGDLVNHADRRLYLAKQKGRNRICVNDEGKSSFA